MTIAIEPARLRDSPLLAELWVAMMRDLSARDQRIVLSEWSGDFYQSYVEHHIRNDESDVLVARDGPDGPIVGYCLAHVSHSLPMFLPEKYGYLSDIVLQEGWRRRRIGRALVERIESAMKRRGISTIQLHVYDCNGQGEAFWQTMGYAPLIQGRAKFLE